MSLRCLFFRINYKKMMNTENFIEKESPETKKQTVYMWESVQE